MKKHILGLALTACALAPLSAQALHLSSTGRGQVLLFPYYTVNSGNQTLISIVNSTGRGKATRLFFREGRNSRLVMEYSIYLAPYDVWTGAVFSLTNDGAANLLTTDNSCTVPALKASGSLPILSNGNRYAPFSNVAYAGNANDAGPDGLGRTREGHFELIEMGEVTNERFGTLAAITQNAVTGVPANCEQLIQAWAVSGYFWSNFGVDITPPGGGLYGSAYYIDALGGTMQVVAADAIEGFTTRAMHLNPGSGSPTLADAQTDGYFDPIRADVFVDGAPITLQYPPSQSIDAVSAVLMADEIHNEFVTAASVGGASEWVVTFPTKRFYTHIVGDGLATPPFTRGFATASDGVARALVDFDFDAWSRAGLAVTCIPPFHYFGCGFGTPPPSEPIRLSWASNVVSFNQAEGNATGTAILGSSLSFGVDAVAWDGVADGAFRMSLWSSNSSAPSNRHLLRPDIGGRRLRGLPVQGFWVASYTNGQLTPGVLSNYSDAVRHQSGVSLSTGSL